MSEQIRENIRNLSDYGSILPLIQSLQVKSFNYKKIVNSPATGERIDEKIKNETGFHCYHKPCEGYSMGRGTHVIVIPIEKYSDDLKTELKSKYDY